MPLGLYLLKSLRFLARDIVRRSVCPSVTQVDQSKTAEVRIMQLFRSFPTE